MCSHSSTWNDKDSAAIEVVTRALYDPNWYVRSVAVWALGEFGKESSVEPLVFALSDKHIRIEAARALGAIKSDRAVGALIGALKDEDRYFREEAIQALGEIKDRRAIKPLIDSLFLIKK